MSYFADNSFLYKQNDMITTLESDLRELLAMTWGKRHLSALKTETSGEDGEFEINETECDKSYDDRL